MKRAIAIIVAAVLYAAGFARATPDPYVHERIVQLQRLNGENLADDAELIKSLGQANTDKATLQKDKDDLQKKVDSANGWLDAIPSLTLDAIGGFAALVCAYAVLTNQYREAIVLGCIAAANFAASLAISHCSKEIGVISAIVGGLLLLAGVVYLIYSAWHYRHAAEEHANVLPLLKKTGLFTAEQIKKMDAVGFQETGKLADRVRSWVTGLSKAKLADDGTKDIPAAPSAIVPVSVPIVAVTSGVVTPLTPAGQ